MNLFSKIVFNCFLSAPIAPTIAAISCLPLIAQEKEREVQQDRSILLAPWTGPFGGVPPWNLVRENEFLGAFEDAIAEADREIQEIANADTDPTFQNTILSMESAGDTLNRLSSIFFVYASNLNLGPVGDIEKVVVPKLTEHEDRIYQNEIGRAHV